MSSWADLIRDAADGDPGEEGEADVIDGFRREAAVNHMDPEAYAKHVITKAMGGLSPEAQQRVARRVIEDLGGG